MSFADVTLPSIFGDNMVLQQQSEAAIWGKARAGSTVRVTTSWDRRSYSARTDIDGSWKVKVQTPAAGGPFTIRISENNTITLQNVLIGEVWICSGQSNMEMPMKGYRNQPVTGSNELIASSGNNNIRLFTVAKATSLTPLENFTGNWKTCEPENVGEFSATAYYFGLMLNEVLGVPVGLINTSWGGTRIEPWISETGLSRYEWVKLPDKTEQGMGNMMTPTALFNAMVNPMVGYGIRGAIWYQGESNRNEYEQYEKLLPGMVENWRSLWGAGEFPFYYVQIAPYDYTPQGGANSAYLREAQLKASTAIPNIGMACIMDTGEKDCIHPANKEAAGNRLALLALARTYGMKGFACEGPVFKEMKVEGNLARLTFDNAPNGLTSFGKELKCFEVAGSNRRFLPAQAIITNTGITVFSPLVNTPAAVRYAFKDFVIGDLFNTEGLPASSFRTDTWEEK
ncbi:MAG: sialate O-acetylesterase [Bacteroidales bacterium]|nr:sialate O-acetylesterase [Bacteroidales bacterium]